MSNTPREGSLSEFLMNSPLGDSGLDLWIPDRHEPLLPRRDNRWADEHVCVTGTATEDLVWHVPRLWQLASDLPVKLIPLETVTHYLSGHWGPDAPTGFDVADHVRRVLEVDVWFPIIFAAEGYLMDGMHRLLKAYVLGHEEIRSVRFPVTPEPNERRPKPLHM